MKPDFPIQSPGTLAELTTDIADYNPDALPVAHAQEIIRRFVQPVHAVEKLALRQSLGRVLAEDIVSAINVPAHDNSAMDGYAFRICDLTGAPLQTLKIAGIALAGKAFNASVQTGECVRIMTGAVMPEGCDTVIPQEMTSQADQNEITFARDKVRPGDNRRLKGEDLALGKTALQRGKVLRAADLGLLASLGVAEVPVQRRLRVAFFSTGDELRSIGEPLDEGCIYDSNRYTLYGMLERLNCELIDMGVIKDEPAALEAAFRSACENADAVITSGGVSVGAADYTKQMMAKLGDVTFWSIGMRPGRPLAFGKIGSNGHQAYLFGLPGNPVAVMVTFYFFARNALLHMMGAQVSPPALVPAVSETAIRKRPGRTEYQRGILTTDASGQLRVRVTGSQGSGILRSMSEANCMIVLKHEQGNIAAGEQVETILFDGLL